MHCKKVLIAKYQYWLAKLKTISIHNINKDLNIEVDNMLRLFA
jgi:hypothetical protein